ncbi:hypothetical protein Pst134EA_024162 [Puccinia striiformis f. sp. tritici]|uniref:hypothetical protein n=1 Tax=Puccinia striiformis f. sp. tritici TaxID=168172 RepID=UPI002008ACAB|nr:hypothetical protein Pst134EA_024162 [Puccinia striiformis f. sp. tritici]KAH9453280.1 hypothetical protein Pst134EA_024162 [Puccinia striiformis f. sp. tritici]
MFPKFIGRRVSTGDASSSYSRSDTAPSNHSPNGPLDGRGDDCTMQGTTAISNSSSPTAVDSCSGNTDTLRSSSNKHVKYHESPGSVNARPTFLAAQVSSASVPSSKWRAPWARSAKSVTSQGNQPQADDNTNTQEKLELLGYSQELHRTWDFWSLFSLAFCNATVLQGAFGAVSVSYALGGPIFLTVGLSITTSLWSCLNAAFAEMLSAYPMSGAMFSWTYKLARANPRLRDWARILSWVVGFLLFVSHLVVQLQIGLEFARSFSTVITASGVDWKVTKNVNALLVIGFILVSGLVSCLKFIRYPLFWKVAAILTFMVQISVCIALKATSKRQRSFASLFTSSKSKYNSPSKGWNILFGWVGSTFFVGSESVAHMAEESKNAAKTAPRAMFFSSVLIGVMQLLCCACIGMAITPMKHKATGYPVIDVIFAHCPRPVAQFVSYSLVATSFVANVSQFFGTSRFFWALARDKALPMSKMWRKVTSDRRPVRATFLMIGTSMTFGLLSLLHSDIAIRALAVANAHLVGFVYLAPLLLYAFSEKDVFNRDGSNVWTLGRFSRPITWTSIAFLTLVVVIQAGPTGFPVTALTFPWGPFILVATIFVSLAFWFLYGRSHYAGPIKSLTTWTVGYEVEIPKQMPNVHPRQEKAEHFDHPRTMEPTTNGRSLANLASQQRTEFDLPQAYCTYDSTGSLWSATESQVPNQSFFHE